MTDHRRTERDCEDGREGAAQTRILLIAHGFPPRLGGSCVVYDALACGAGGRVTVLTSRRDHRTGAPIPRWRDADAAAPFRVTRVPLVRPRLGEPGASRARRLRRLIFGDLPVFVRTAAAAAWLTATERADAVVLGDDETMGWLVGFVQKVLRRPAAIYCHGDDVARAPEGRAGRRRRRWLAAADAVVAAGGFAHERLTTAWGVDPAKTVLIANGVDRTRFRPGVADPALRARLGLRGGPALLSVGRLEPRKGVDRAIEALPRILERHPDAVYLVVGDGGQRPELEALAARLGVAERVVFAGAAPHGEMPAYYALADLFLAPFRAAEDGEADGLALTLLEAAACGLPIVAGDVGGALDVVRDGENGLLVDGRDPERIAEAATRILTDGPLRSALRDGALATARDAGWERRAEALLDLCGRLAARRRAGGGAASGSRRARRAPAAPDRENPQGESG